MEEKIITSTIKVCQLNEIDGKEQELIQLAIQATERSYAPYSKFNVGAAVLLANGTTIQGCNQENAAFGVCMCAERTAIFSAGAQYPGVPIVAIAIAARNSGGMLEEPVTPCGSCRQAMIETEIRGHRKLHILLYGTRHIFSINGIETLMPLSFSDEQL